MPGDGQIGCPLDGPLDTGDPGVFLADLRSESRFLGGPGGRIVGKPDASSAGMSGR